jgi:hypothetical protein
LPDAAPAVFPDPAVHVADEALPPVEHVVWCVVAFVGFMPACWEPAFWLALPFVEVDVELDFFAPWLLPPPLVEVVADDPLSFPFPLVLAELPVAWEVGSVAGGAAWELPLPLPWPAPFPCPLPARAEPANVPRMIVSTIVPRIAVHFVISFSPRIRTTFPQYFYGAQTPFIPIRIRVFAG